MSDAQMQALDEKSRYIAEREKDIIEKQRQFELRMREVAKIE